MALSGKKILIVDDDKRVRDVVSAALAALGHATVCCANGEEALKVLKETAPALIILDMNMPKMGGVAFFHEIASKIDGKPRYPVLVLTGRAELQPVFEDFHVDGFIAKPFEINDLSAKVSDILDACDKKAGQNRESWKKIVIVEDDVESFNEISHALSQRPYDIKRVKDGTDLLAHVKMFQSDLVFYKVGEPSLQGPEFLVAARLKSLIWPKLVPVVMYTRRQVSASPQDAEQIMQSAGVFAVISEATPKSLLDHSRQVFRDT